MKKYPTLRVRPNPYHALDAEGMPAGIVRVDPEVGRPGAIEFIGVVVRKDVVDDPDNKRRESIYRRRSMSFQWAAGAVEIPATPYHIDAVRSGAIFADDQASARECRIWFVPPAVALEQAKAKAIAEWRASHGEPPPIEAWADALKSGAKAAALAKKPDELPLLRPWDAPIEQGASAPEVK